MYTLISNEVKFIINRISNIQQGMNTVTNLLEADNDNFKVPELCYQMANLTMFLNMVVSREYYTREDILECVMKFDYYKFAKVLSQDIQSALFLQYQFVDLLDKLIDTLGVADSSLINFNDIRIDNTKDNNQDAFRKIRITMSLITKIIICFYGVDLGEGYSNLVGMLMAIKADMAV